jgi:hypothetical protein
LPQKDLKQRASEGKQLQVNIECKRRAITTIQHRTTYNNPQQMVEFTVSPSMEVYENEPEKCRITNKEHSRRVDRHLPALMDEAATQYAALKDAWDQLMETVEAARNDLAAEIERRGEVLPVTTTAPATPAAVLPPRATPQQSPAIPSAAQMAFTQRQREPGSGGPSEGGGSASTFG